MKVQNSPTFCGKVYNPDNIQGIGHLLTRSVKYRMQFAPTGTGLHFEKSVHPDGVSIGFTIPGDALTMGVPGFTTLVDGEACVTGLSGPKSKCTEEFVLTIIENGIRRMRQGFTQG